MSDFKLVKLLDGLSINVDADGLLHKYDATADPTVNDDSGDGYGIGSRWINVTADSVWSCTDASVGAAVWKDLSTQGAGGGGTGVAFVWKFDTGTGAGPASGDLRFNNATPASVTAIYVNEVSDNGSDLATVLAQLSAGMKLYIQQADDNTRFLLVTIVSTVDNGTDWTINVTVDDSGVLPQNNEELGVIAFGASGTSYTDEQAQDAVGNIITDSASINFTYDDGAPSITGVVLPAGVDHNSLANLTTGDPHTQYALESSLATVATSGSHLDLSNIGTNSHAAIDSHITDSTIHFTQAAIAIAASQVTSGTFADARISSSSVLQHVNLTGDITSTGNATAIATGVIVNADINASAAIAHSKMAALSLSLPMVTDGSGFATTQSYATLSASILHDSTSGYSAARHKLHPTSTDNAIARYDSTAGDLQNSVVIIGDADGAGVSEVSGVGRITIRSTNYSGDMSSAAWGMAGLKVTGSAATLTDTSTAASGTVAAGTIVVLAQGTLAATNANVTYTNYYGAYAYAPVAGSNITIGSSWALGADSLRIGNTDNFVTVTAGGIFRASALDPFADNWFMHKGFIHAATTANISLASDISNGDTLDGFLLETGDRVLVKNQTNAAENGIYVVTAGTATRATDADTWTEVENMIVNIANGTVNAGKNYRTYDNVGGTLGTDPLVFEAYSGPDRLAIVTPPISVAATNNNGGFSIWFTSPNGYLNISGTSEYAAPVGTGTGISATPAVNYSATTTVSGSSGWSTLGAGFLFWANGIHTITGTGAVGPFYTIVGQMNVNNGSTSNKTIAINNDCYMDTRFNCTSSGTLTISDHNSFRASITTQHANVTVGVYRGYLAADVTETAGSVTGHAGVCVANLTNATNKSLLLLGNSTTIPTGNFCINQDTNTFVNKLNGGLRQPTRVLNTTTITMTVSDTCVTNSNTGATTVNVPDATTCAGLTLIFKKLGTGVNANTLTSAGGNFDSTGATTLAVTVQDTVVIIMSNGTGWIVLKNSLI